MTFQVDTGLDGGWQSWRDTAQSLARLEPLNCTDDVIGMTATMVNDADLDGLWICELRSKICLALAPA